MYAGVCFGGSVGVWAMVNAALISREFWKASTRLSLSLFIVGSLSNQVIAYFVGKNAMDDSEDSPAMQFYGNGFFNVPSLVLHATVLAYVLVIAFVEECCLSRSLTKADLNQQLHRSLVMDIAAVWGAYVAMIEFEVTSMSNVPPLAIRFLLWCTRVIL